MVISSKGLHSFNNIWRHFRWSCNFKRWRSSIPCAHRRHDSLNSALARVEAFFDLLDRSVFGELISNLLFRCGLLGAWRHSVVGHSLVYVISTFCVLVYMFRFMIGQSYLTLMVFLSSWTLRDVNITYGNTARAARNHYISIHRKTHGRRNSLTITTSRWRSYLHSCDNLRMDLRVPDRTNINLG
jgi:hypothetical protein